MYYFLREESNTFVTKIIYIVSYYSSNEILPCHLHFTSKWISASESFLIFVIDLLLQCLCFPFSHNNFNAVLEWDFWKANVMCDYLGKPGLFYVFLHIEIDIRKKSAWFFFPDEFVLIVQEIWCVLAISNQTYQAISVCSDYLGVPCLQCQQFLQMT